ncbi:MAG: NmrA family NAD(P)-binding protein [Ornithinimicrobium sp.]
MNKSPILVTGATGNVGKPVVEALVAAGMPVRAATGPSTRRTGPRTQSSLPSDRRTPVVLDFTDPATWARAYEGVERMFLLRPPHLSKPKTQMLPSLEAAKTAGVRHIVLLSLQGAEGNRFVPHAALEAWLRGSGLSWTFIRASFFMQNLTTTHCSDIRDRDEIMMPAGHGATAFVDAVDVAAVAARALLDPEAHHSRAWTPTGPAALTYTEIAQTLSDTLGRPIRYANPGALRYILHARRTLEMPWSMVAVTTAIYTVARLGKADGLTEDVHQVLGRDPVSFRAFAQTHANSWQR